MQQTTNTIVMIRPVNFKRNEQTVVNNYFQVPSSKELPALINAKAQQEFDAFVKQLKTAGISIVVFDDKEDDDTPDAIFPNNWISFHENGNIALYPLFAENRRLERREDVLEHLEQKGFLINDIIDYTSAEDEEIFLEGTGSMVLDRANRKAYCALSSRSDEELFIEFCEDFEFTPIIFTANLTIDGLRKPIYHTNVMLSVGETFAVVCLEAIDDKKERKNLLKNLKEDTKEIIIITENQMRHFAGNILQVCGEKDDKYIVMSETAYKSFKAEQIKQLEKHGTIIYSDLKTIEANGGGSARCIMAEVFLPKA